MKKLSSLLVLVLVSIFVWSGLPTSARNATLEERFAVQNSVEEGGSGTYNFDGAHTSIGFRVKHLGLVDVPGYFREFTGAIKYDAKDVTKSSVEFTAKAASIDTGVDRRDNHLRSADFFEVEKYPELTFKSTKVEKNGNGLTLTGDLTMKGVTKTVSFPFKLVGFVKDARSGATRMGATAETVINRRDFGVTYGSNLPNGTPVLADNVTVVLNIEAILPAPKPEAGK